MKIISRTIETQKSTCYNKRNIGDGKEKIMNLITKLALPDYAIDYLISLSEKGRAESTIKRYSYDLFNFFSWKREKDKKELSFEVWRQLSEEEYGEYFKFLVVEKEHADRTINRIFIVLKRMAIYYNSIGKTATIPEMDFLLEDTQGKSLTEKDFISEEEFTKLIHTIKSEENLSNNQLKTRHLLVDRNISLLYMMYYEGLALREVIWIMMKDINFIQNTLKIHSYTSNSRELTIPGWRKKQYYTYYQTIPEAVRPKMYTSESFFCAFNFKMGTYQYVFEGVRPLYPKEISAVSVQRMIQKELKRANLRKGIGPQHFRNTAILNAILAGDNKTELMYKFGFKKEKSLERYLNYARSLTK